MNNLPVLVYGTLRPGGSNYGGFLQGLTTAEQNVQLEGFIMYGESGCPFLDRGDRVVTATLVHLEENHYQETLAHLDLLEGYRGPGDDENSYERILHTFTLDGVKTQAWVYVMSDSLKVYVLGSTPVLESGDWIAHVRDREQQWMDEFDQHAAEGMPLY